MHSLNHYGENGLTCVEVRPAGHAYVRWFRYPYQLVQVLRPDGQPDCDWDWFACLEMHAGNVLWAFGAKGMPTMDEFRDILVAATRLGASQLRFEHRGRIHSFSLSKYLRDKPSKPNQIEQMTFNTKAQLINDETGKTEVDVTVNIYNLDSKEGTATLADAVKGITAAVSGYDAQTGDPV